MLLANSGGETPGTLGYFPVGATRCHADQQQQGGEVHYVLAGATRVPCAGGDGAGCAGAPLGIVAFSTNPFGINPAAVIVGQYQLVSGGAPHGFVAVPTDAD